MNLGRNKFYIFYGIFTVLLWGWPSENPWHSLVRAVLIIPWLGLGLIVLSTLWKLPSAAPISNGNVDRIKDLHRHFPFVRPDSRVFTESLEVNFTPRGDVAPYATLRRLSPTSAEDWDKAIFLLQRSAMFERYKRGYPLRDNANEFVAPEVIAEGFVIERSEHEDGSVSGLVAYDIKEPVSQQDYDEAWRKLDLVGRSDIWKRTLLHPWQTRYHFDDIAPLYRPALKEVQMTAGESSANRNPMRPPSTEKGSAQWAWVDEMQASPSVGYVHRSATNWEQRFDAPGAPLGAFLKANWTNWPQDDYAHVFMQGEGHRIILGPSGTGKFTAVFAPLLLMADNASAVVFDIKKGEAARITAPWRATLGPVHVIDPFGVSGLESGSLNPLDFLDPNDPDILQAAKRLTDAIFIAPPGGSNEEYFNDQAREVLTAYLLHVATDFSEKDRRTLKRIRHLIRRPLDPAVLAAMQDNDIAEGFVQDVAATLVEAMRTEAERNTFFVMRTLSAMT